MTKVIVYSKTACGKCVFTKKWLESKGIPYEEKQIGRASCRERV